MERFTAKTLSRIIDYANSLGTAPDGFVWWDYQAYGGHLVMLRHVRGTWCKDLYYRRGTPRHAATEWLLWLAENMPEAFDVVYDEAYDLGIRV